MRKLLLIILFVTILVTCKKEKIEETVNEKTDNQMNEKIEDNIKKVVPTSEEVLTTILTAYNNDESLSKLLSMPVKINISPDNNYYFVCSTDCENFYDSPIIIETGFNLSDIEFKTGDVQWWIVFDNKQNKIILKNVDLALIGNVLWDLDHEYVIFNLGTDLTRSLIFNSLIDKVKIFTISAVTNGDKLYYFSPNNNKIAFCYHGESNDDFYEPGIQETDKVWLGIKILDISTGSQTAIKPETDGGKLTINNWKSDVEIEYTETNNIITIDEKKVTYKL